MDQEVPRSSRGSCTIPARLLYDVGAMLAAFSHRNDEPKRVAKLRERGQSEAARDSLRVYDI